MSQTRENHDLATERLNVKLDVIERKRKDSDIHLHMPISADGSGSVVETFNSDNDAIVSTFEYSAERSTSNRGPFLDLNIRQVHPFRKLERSL